MDNKQLKILLRQYLKQLEHVKSDIESKLSDKLMKQGRTIIGDEYTYYPEIQSLEEFIDELQSDIDHLE